MKPQWWRWVKSPRVLFRCLLGENIYSECGGWLLGSSLASRRKPGFWWRGALQDSIIITLKNSARRTQFPVFRRGEVLFWWIWLTDKFSFELVVIRPKVIGIAIIGFLFICLLESWEIVGSRIPEKRMQAIVIIESKQAALLELFSLHIHCHCRIHLCQGVRALVSLSLSCLPAGAFL